MLAIDTNLIVRYLTADHPEQAANRGRQMRGIRQF
jgi:predicted nucleic acid-binding protein